MTDGEGGASPFVGPSGVDWCCRTGIHGPPDSVTDCLLQWLIVPGPPISAYLTYCLPREDPSDMQFFHSHPKTWSIHIVLSGRGEYAVEGRRLPVGAGSVMYHGPGVPHSIYPLPNEHLAFIAVQHPSIGFAEKEWVPSPESGTVERFGDVQAFVDRFGRPEDLADLQRVLFKSDRWRAYTQRSKAVK